MSQIPILPCFGTQPPPGGQIDFAKICHIVLRIVLPFQFFPIESNWKYFWIKCFTGNGGFLVGGYFSESFRGWIYSLIFLGYFPSPASWIFLWFQVFGGWRGSAWQSGAVKKNCMGQLATPPSQLPKQLFFSFLWQCFSFVFPHSVLFLKGQKGWIFVPFFLCSLWTLQDSQAVQEMVFGIDNERCFLHPLVISN